MSVYFRMPIESITCIKNNIQALLAEQTIFKISHENDKWAHLTQNMLSMNYYGTGNTKIIYIHELHYFLMCFLVTEMNDKMYVSVSLESYRSGFLLLDGTGLEIHYTDKSILQLVPDSIWTNMSMYRVCRAQQHIMDYLKHNMCFKCQLISYWNFLGSSKLAGMLISYLKV